MNGSDGWHHAGDATREALGVDRTILGPIEKRLDELFPVPVNDDFAEKVGQRIDANERRRNITFILNGAYYLCMISIFAWLAAQVFDRALPIKIFNERLVTDTVPQGGLVKFEVEFQSLRAYDLDINWNLKDLSTNEVRRFDGRHVDIDAPTPRHKDVFVYPIPRDFPAGRACLRVSLSYAVAGNYLHRFFPVGFTYPDFCFTVTVTKP